MILIVIIIPKRRTRRSSWCFTFHAKQDRPGRDNNSLCRVIIFFARIAPHTMADGGLLRRKVTETRERLLATGICLYGTHLRRSRRSNTHGFVFREHKRKLSIGDGDLSNSNGQPHTSHSDLPCMATTTTENETL